MTSKTPKNNSNKTISNLTHRPPSSAQYLMHWILRNRGWFDKVSAKNLPQEVVVSSVLINENCNYEKVPQNLAGPMSRVLLMDGADYIVLDPPVEGYELIMPITMYAQDQNCKIYEVGLFPGLTFIPLGFF